MAHTTYDVLLLVGVAGMKLFSALPSFLNKWQDLHMILDRMATLPQTNMETHIAPH